MSDASHTPEKSKIPHAFAAFASVPFRWLMGSHLIFFLAMQGQFLVRSLLAWDLTDSELALAYVNLVIAVPMVIGSFMGGAIIDRVERKRLIMISQTVIIVNEMLILALLISGLLEFWHLLVTSFILGVMFPYVMPTRVAMIFPMVGRAHLANAMALQAGALNLARVLGPALIGLLVAIWSLTGACIIALSLYFISMFCMMKVKPCFPEKREKKSLLADIAESFSYVRNHRGIFMCLLFGVMPMLIVLPVFSLMVVFADEVWQVGEIGLGMLMAMLGLGGTIGALWVAKTGENIKRTRSMVVTALLFAIFLGAFSISKSFILALILLFVANVFSNISQTLNNTIIQLLAHEKMRGRMSSLVMVSMGLTPLGVLPISIASEKYGISVAVFASCVLLAFIILMFFFFSPTLRSLDKDMTDTASQPLDN